MRFGFWFSEFGVWNFGNGGHLLDLKRFMQLVCCWTGEETFGRADGGDPPGARDPAERVSHRSGSDGERPTSHGKCERYGGSGWRPRFADWRPV